MGYFLDDVLKAADVSSQDLETVLAGALASTGRASWNDVPLETKNQLIPWTTFSLVFIKLHEAIDAEDEKSFRRILDTAAENKKTLHMLLKICWGEETAQFNLQEYCVKKGNDTFTNILRTEYNPQIFPPPAPPSPVQDKSR